MRNYLQPIALVALLYLCNLNFLSAQCIPDHQEVHIKFRGDENTTLDNSRWEIRSIAGQIIKTGQTDAIHCLPQNACYSFHVIDDYGDGLGGESPGFYSITYEEEQVAFGTYFGFEQSAYFGGCRAGSSCFSPIAAETDVSYTVDRGEEWYTFTPATSGYYEITSCGFENSCNTAIWVYDRCLGLTGAESQQETILYNDDYCEEEQAVVSGVFFASTTYYLRLGDKNNDCAQESFSWSLRFLGEVVGCMDPEAINYHPLATIDSGDCEYEAEQSIVSGPDLIVKPNVLANTIYTSTVNGSGCYIEEGCIQGFGPRQVLRFTTHILNVGNEDYVIGAPDENSGQFEFDDCHGHWHQEGYAEYRVYDANNNLLPVGFKNGFCVLDLECSGGGTATYGCNYMGISAGCGDIYSSFLDCQWIDVTDMPDGIYTLVITVNWDQDPDIFGRDELSYDNNSDMICFELSRNSSGAHSISLFSGCEFPVDCEGIVLGDAQTDCLGVCNGDDLYGDLNGNVIYDPGDVNLYIDGILDSNLPVFNCTELTGNDLIDLEDPVWLMECILTENSADGHDSHAHACQLPTTGLTNPDEWAEFSLLEHNM
ncbi:MAG: lysyl oxidase family protein, partial [Bacteroidota bacterium]